MPDLSDSFKVAPVVNWRCDKPEKPGVWWRFESSVYWRESPRHGPVVSIYATRWLTLRDTPQGAWLVDEYCNIGLYDLPEEGRDRWERATIDAIESSKKLVQNWAKKKWAYPTKDEAWKSFKIRQYHREHHARRALDNANAVYAAAKEFDGAKTAPQGS